MKGKNISIYLSEQRLAKLGENPTAKLREIIDSLGGDNNTPAPTVDNAELTGMKFRIEKLEDRVEELQNNIDAVANELI